VCRFTRRDYINDLSHLHANYHITSQSSQFLSGYYFVYSLIQHFFLRNVLKLKKKSLKMRHALAASNHEKIIQTQIDGLLKCFAFD
jgi:hypothetical protein